MSEYRIIEHPVLPIPKRDEVVWTWQGRPLYALEGEMLAAALFAQGIRVFGHHPKDGAPQGIFCANGQCAQCLVLADGRPVKACMTPVRAGMRVDPLDGLPALPSVGGEPAMRAVEERAVAVLILGGGPAGLSAAVELGQLGVEVLLVDDKDRLGGKLVLQTHRFFGSTETVYAGTRGIDIAARLERQARTLPGLDIWLNSTALAVFSDQKVGIWRGGREYVLVQPQVLLVATGAREKSLIFAGNTLPGVYGAGAFQTLVNRDLVRAARRLSIVGGGNVGLIAGYHALQAGIEVVGLVEALPECGGYQVHRDKLARLGVPIYTSHTILSANGAEGVESVTIARVDARFRPVPGSERTLACDTVLIAVGLDPVDEFYRQAAQFGMTVWAAGDAEEIAEASAAMITGRIRGREVARMLGVDVGPPPPDWYRLAEVLKSRPGAVESEPAVSPMWGIRPVLHCVQEIPCDPCVAACPQGLIQIAGRAEGDIRSRPAFVGEADACVGCLRCVVLCPGLAITLVDERQNADYALVSLPWELGDGMLRPGDEVEITDMQGGLLCRAQVERVRVGRANDRTAVVQVRVAAGLAGRAAGFRRAAASLPQEVWAADVRLADEEIVCRCERVTAGEIRALIRQGYRDLNEIKAVSRAGMGACGGKTCAALIRRLFREEGVPPDQVIDAVRRPLFVETPLGVLAGIVEQESDHG